MEITLKQLPQNVQQLIAEINGTNQTLTITDAGKPLAIISPVTKQKRAAFGCIKNTFGKLLMILFIPQSRNQNRKLKSENTS